MIKIFLDWFKGSSPGDDPLKIEATAWKRRTFLALILGFLLGGILVSGCKPDHVKDTLETTKTVEKLTQTNKALTEQNTKLHDLATAYEKKQKTRKTQKGYLDGKGEAVRDAKGNPVILETVTILNSESGSSRETMLEDQNRILSLRNTELSLNIDTLKKTHEESNDPLLISIGGDFNISTGVYQPNVGIGYRLIKFGGAGFGAHQTISK